MMPPTAANVEAIMKQASLTRPTLMPAAAGRLGVAAGRVDVPAERRLGEQEGQADQQDQQDRHHDRDALDARSSAGLRLRSMLSQ